MSEAKHDAEPRAQRIERPTADDGMAATSHSTACCGLCAMRSGTAPRARKQRAETVFYDSSTARRSLLGAVAMIGSPRGPQSRQRAALGHASLLLGSACTPTRRASG